MIPGAVAANARRPVMVPAAAVVIGYFAICGIIAVLRHYDETRFAWYATPFVLIGLLFVPDRVVLFDGRGAWGASCILAAALASVIVALPLNFYLLNNAVILLLSLAIFFFRMRVGDRSVKAAFLVLVCLNVLEYASGAVPYIPGMDILGSNGGLESSYGLSIGLFAVFFLHKRWWAWAALAALATIIALKRSSYIGVLLFGVLPVAYQFVQTRYRAPSAPARIRYAPFILAYVCIALVGTHMFLILTTLSRGALVRYSVNQLTMGRFEYLGDLQLWQAATPFTQKLFGGGPGATAAGLAALGIKDLLHNDFAKILFEYGYIGSIAVQVGIVLLIVRGRISRYLLLYQSIIFLTDNTFIYFYNWLSLYLLIQADLDDGERDLSGARVNSRLQPIPTQRLRETDPCEPRTLSRDPAIGS